jgi:hypothetical protein
MKNISPMIKRYSFIIAIFFSLIVFSGCSSTLTTHTVNSMNNFQDGETIGKDNFNFGFSYGTGQHIKKEVSIEVAEIDDEHVFEYDVKTTKSQTAIINFITQRGIRDDLDILLSGYLSYYSFGGKAALKYNLLSSDLALSLMPGFGYSRGSSSASRSVFPNIYPGTYENGSFKAKSHLLFAEFNIPMSYEFSENFALHFSLDLIKYFHVLSTDFSYSSSSDSFGDSEEFSDNFLNPGISAGCRWKHIYPEVKTVYADDELMIFFGIAFKLENIPMKKKR